MSGEIDNVEVFDNEGALLRDDAFGVKGSGKHAACGAREYSLQLQKGGRG